LQFCLLWIVLNVNFAYSAIRFYTAINFCLMIILYRRTFSVRALVSPATTTPNVTPSEPSTSTRCCCVVVAVYRASYASWPCPGDGEGLLGKVGLWRAGAAGCRRSFSAAASGRGASSACALLTSCASVRVAGSTVPTASSTWDAVVRSVVMTTRQPVTLTMVTLTTTTSMTMTSVLTTRWKRTASPVELISELHSTSC